MSPSRSAQSVIALLKTYAQDEIKKQYLQLDAEQVDFDKRKSAIDFAKSNLSNFVQLPDGSFPCPICFVGGQNISLIQSISANFLSCPCGFNDKLFERHP